MWAPVSERRYQFAFSKICRWIHAGKNSKIGMCWIVPVTIRPRKISRCSKSTFVRKVTYNSALSESSVSGGARLSSSNRIHSPFSMALLNRPCEITTCYKTDQFYKQVLNATTWTCVKRRPSLIFLHILCIFISSSCIQVHSTRCEFSATFFFCKTRTVVSSIKSINSDQSELLKHF